MHERWKSGQRSSFQKGQAPWRAEIPNQPDEVDEPDAGDGVEGLGVGGLRRVRRVWIGVYSLDELPIRHTQVVESRYNQYLLFTYVLEFKNLLNQ